MLNCYWTQSSITFLMYSPKKSSQISSYSSYIYSLTAELKWSWKGWFQEASLVGLMLNTPLRTVQNFIILVAILWFQLKWSHVTQSSWLFSILAISVKQNSSLNGNQIKFDINTQSYEQWARCKLIQNLNG